MAGVAGGAADAAAAPRRLPAARRGRAAHRRRRGSAAAFHGRRFHRRGWRASAAASMVARRGGQGGHPGAARVQRLQQQLRCPGAAVGGARNRHLCLRPARLWRRAGARIVGGQRLARRRCGHRQPDPARPLSWPPALPARREHGRRGRDPGGNGRGARGCRRTRRVPAAEADGVVLSGPAVWGRSTMDLLPKLTLFAGVRLFPSMVLTGRGLHIVASDNMPMLQALARDPMVIKGARIDTIYGVVNLMDDALAAAPHLNLPTLMMYGAHDEVVPRRPIAVFVARLPPDPAHRRTLAYYPKGYHMLLRDLEGPVVAGDVASWVLGRGGALPSRADATQGVKPWPPERLATAGALLATGRR